MSPSKDVLLSIMTWNIYLGADLTPIATAPPAQIPERVTQVFRQFLATSFPSRANTITKQILKEKPDIIGLQEAVLLELVPPNSHRVIYDFVDILLNELEREGFQYRLVAMNQGNTTELPSSSGNLIRFTDRDAILVRKESDVKIIDTAVNNFKTNLQIPFGGTLLTILRGWSAIDACIHGHMFRLVNTHLEPLSPAVQVAQGNELLSGPGVTTLPLIFIGDFNSNANGSGTPTYGNMIASGFGDTWLITGHGEGFTTHQDPDLLNAESHLTERIDFILIKNKDDWEVVQVKLIGEDQSDRTYSRLWPSDHAGIVAKFDL
jgi:hypothetical protein